MQKKLISLATVCVALMSVTFSGFSGDPPARHNFAIGPNDFLLDGKPFLIRCGEIHAPRVPKEYWRHRMQLARAMGLNTVCAYLFWNLHEPREGKFDWRGQADAAEFCRIAQAEGLWVILRPGPYACAEWEMGGFPWWLLKQDDIKLRTRDPRYLAAAKKYLAEVGRVLGPLQVTKGGPILMVQVENEYGFFGKDAAYMDAVRDTLVDAGFDVPLFACNPPNQMVNGLLPDLFQAGNFGSDVKKNFEKVRQIQKTGPLICSEFYPGWFDTWGAPHHLGKPENYLPNLKLMLEMRASFSIYMAHGGTTFGLWAGADRPFKPDISSYDYDAPISEAGWTTSKFFQTRQLFAQHLNPHETIPDPPAENPVIAIPEFELRQAAPVRANLPSPVTDTQPRNMEAYDQGYGCILYRTELPAGPAGRVDATAIHDFGYVFLDGRRIAITDRRSGKFSFAVPERATAAQLDILVEPMGRVNFGPEVHDRKGIRAPVKFTGHGRNAVELAGWSIFNLPLDSDMLTGLKFGGPAAAEEPAFWRGSFTVDPPGDTFLDLRNWGKGVIWVNGHCLARFWNIGPSQTAYLPGAWLKSGKNEIIILDHLGPVKPVVAGLKKPILDELRPQLDFARVGRKPLQEVAAQAVVHQGTFFAGPELQEVKFKAPVNGRYFEIKSLNAFDGKPFAAIAEISLLDTDGKPLGAESWKIASVDSEESEKEDGTAGNVIDGQTANFWHTQWGSATPDHPHWLVIDLGKTETVGGFRYTPRQGSESGRIRNYEIRIGHQLVDLK